MTKIELQTRFASLGRKIQNTHNLINPKYGPDGKLVPRVFKLVKNGKAGLVEVTLCETGRYSGFGPIGYLTIKVGKQFFFISLSYIQAWLVYGHVDPEMVKSVTAKELKRMIPALEAVLYGLGEEVTDDDKILSVNGHTLLSGRIEAGQFDLAPVLVELNKLNRKFDYFVFLKSFQESIHIMTCHQWELWLDEKVMDLVELKRHLLDANIPADVHVLIESLDYAQYQRLRDRKSPYPLIHVSE